eukprot:COSAG05_NODE_1609_length_4412_cov_2.348018_6_plen_122_part_00
MEPVVRAYRFVGLEESVLRDTYGETAVSHDCWGGLLAAMTLSLLLATASAITPVAASAPHVSDDDEQTEGSGSRSGLVWVLTHAATVYLPALLVFWLLSAALLYGVVQLGAGRLSIHASAR